ncbi:unnamed protein product [Ilex paraguariensis]|uniref:Uncharacterized protein n=1 Tax=Ilex paraguariensis TaxID=185542 RepID=A0ABC8V431_9AQUA
MCGRKPDPRKRERYEREPERDLIKRNKRKRKRKSGHSRRGRMRVSSKPVSSPSRTEKFQPPLMLRFLRSNVGSRSRGRSRSSPMFVRKKNAVIETTQEPSSPKVTCMGQVRVRRSSKNNSGSKTGRRLPRTPAKHRPCLWVRKTLFCRRFAQNHKPKSFRHIWRKCVSFFRFGYCKKVGTVDHSSKVESNGRGQFTVNGSERENENEDVAEEEEQAQVEEANVGFKCSEPPKNAFLLTRCRSAPYRSSSLASRFWGSPLSTPGTGDSENEVNKGHHQQQIGRKIEKPSLEREPNYIAESKDDQESEGNQGICIELMVQSMG